MEGRVYSEHTQDNRIKQFASAWYYFSLWNTIDIIKHSRFFYSSHSFLMFSTPENMDILELLGDQMWFFFPKLEETVTPREAHCLNPFPPENTFLYLLRALSSTASLLVKVTQSKCPINEASWCNWTSL